MNERTMKVLQLLALIFGLVIFANSQINNKSILSGNVYDANGSVIVKAKVTAINQKSEKVETVTTYDGVYTLNLAFNRFNSSAKYDIIVEMAGFKKSVIKDFVFIPSQFGKMHLDIALNSEVTAPCGYGGDLCLESQIVENTKEKVQNTILQKPLAELPKKRNKTKRKINKIK